AAVALDLLVARVAVVGADEDPSAGDDRPAVGLAAQLDGPLDVLLLVRGADDELAENVLLGRVGQVARRRDAEHRDGLRVTLRVGLVGPGRILVEVDDDQQGQGSAEDAEPLRSQIRAHSLSPVWLLLHFALIAHSLHGFSVITYITPFTTTGVARILPF